MEKTNEGSVLFQDYKFCSNSTIIDADAVNGSCFVIESDSNNEVVSLAKKETYGQEYSPKYIQKMDNDTFSQRVWAIYFMLCL